MIKETQIIEIARSWIGTPFHHQSSLKLVGCDCLGLLLGIWRELYGHEPWVPAYGTDWARNHRDDALFHALQKYFIPEESDALHAGRVLLFRWRSNWPASHVGLTTSAQTMIHAYDGCGTCEGPLPASWRKRIVACFAFPPL
jgi:NlpC/P60 family putative phage cell wall peptidase